MSETPAASLPVADRVGLALVLVVSWYFALEPILGADALMAGHGLAPPGEAARNFILTWMISFGSLVIAANLVAIHLFRRYHATRDRRFVGGIFGLYLAISAVMLTSLLIQWATGVLSTLSQDKVAADCVSLLGLTALTGWRWLAIERDTADPTAPPRPPGLVALLLGEWAVFCVHVLEEVAGYPQNPETWTTQIFDLASYEAFRGASIESVSFATALFGLLLLGRRRRAARVGFGLALGAIAIFSAAIPIAESALHGYVPGLVTALMLVTPWTAYSALRLARGVEG